MVMARQNETPHQQMVHRMHFPYILSFLGEQLTGAIYTREKFWAEIGLVCSHVAALGQQRAALGSLGLALE